MARDEAATWQIQIKPRPWRERGSHPESWPLRTLTPPTLTRSSANDGETFTLRLSHIITWKPNLKSLLLHWPHTVHEKNCTKNSSYCWLGSGIKSAALCGGLVSSGLRWWMRRAGNESCGCTLYCHGVLSTCCNGNVCICFYILCIRVSQPEHMIRWWVMADDLMSQWRNKFKVWYFWALNWLWEQKINSLIAWYWLEDSRIAFGGWCDSAHFKGNVRFLYREECLDVHHSFVHHPGSLLTLTSSCPAQLFLITVLQLSRVAGK